MSTANSLINSVGVMTDIFEYLQRSRNENENISELKSEWADQIFKRMNVELELIGKPSDERSMLFLGNHISYFDIPLLLKTVVGLSFVAKKEVSAWPIIGAAAKKIETVFVERDKQSSRSLARASICEALKQGARIAIFPSGTTSVSENVIWRRGAFEIAHEMDLFVQPFRISYKPLRAVAYIDQDFFFTHLYKLCGFDKINARIEFHEPVKITDPEKDCLYWNKWARP